jgi:hypothetical protein
MYDALEGAVKILDKHKDLPECLSVSVNSEGVWLVPWTHGAPITALLAWADVMEPTRAIQATVYQDITSIEICGHIEHLAFHVTTSTHRMVNLSRGDRVSMDELRRIAAEEEAFE